MAVHAHPSWALRLAAAQYRFRESLFLLPATLMIGGIALAVLAAAVDRSLDRTVTIPGALDMSSNAATWLLSTVAGAMITTVGVVFSLTVVTLQLASSQFSPRVMRSFIGDRLSQTVIGMLVATFCYCVLVLPSIHGDSTMPAPRVSLTLAVVLTLVTVVAIIAHLDHLARRLQVGQLLRDIEVEGEDVIDSAYWVPRALRPWATAELQAPRAAVSAPTRSSGWVNQVDAERLLFAVPPGTTVRLETRVGAYIHEGEPLLTVWPAPGPDVLRQLAGAAVVGPSRTMQQDLDFALRQLVDIGLRALSSAINDPSTAVEVVLRVGSLLRKVLTAPLPPTALGDDQGRVLVRPWDLDHDEYVEHGFDQLRQAAPPQPQVAAAILRVLRMLIVHVEAAGLPERVPALRRQLELLLSAVDEEPGLSHADRRYLHSLASDETDPADHSRRAARVAAARPRP